jgi:hypothetical protein
MVSVYTVFLFEEFPCFVFKTINVVIAGNTLTWFDPVSIAISFLSAISLVS